MTAATINNASSMTAPPKNTAPPSREEGPAEHGFTTIVITLPHFFPGEAQRIADLLRSRRADLVHIRKPEAAEGDCAAAKVYGVAARGHGVAARTYGAADDNSYYRLRTMDLIEAIPADLHCQLVLHDCHDLALRYGLHGIHTNRRHPEPPVGMASRAAFSVSHSCHSLDEVVLMKPQRTYVSLSPIFNSISKSGYLSAFTAEEIAVAVRQGIIDNKVYALGGVTFALLPAVRQLGFGGAMILGDAWR